MYCSWIGKICIFVTMINSQDNKILQKNRAYDLCSYALFRSYYFIYLHTIDSTFSLVSLDLLIGSIEIVFSQNQIQKIVRPIVCDDTAFFLFMKRTPLLNTLVVLIRMNTLYNRLFHLYIEILCHIVNC